MKRDYKLFLNDIKDSIQQIEKYTENISQEEFNNDKLIQDAIIRRLEIIGEASRNIPKSLKEMNKQVPWFSLAQFRNFITHSYFDASMKRIWGIIKVDLPKIKESLQKIKLV